MKTNVLQLLALVLFAGSIFTTQTSCEKETENIVSAPDTVSVCVKSLPGLWEGFQQNAVSGQAFICNFRTNGTASYENVVGGVRQLCVGSWTLVNGTLTLNTICVYGRSEFVGAEQTFSAQYNNTTGVLTGGTWVTTSPFNDSGSFTLTEVE
jgi:hypothetical protein